MIPFYKHDLEDAPFSPENLIEIIDNYPTWFNLCYVREHPAANEKVHLRALAYILNIALRDNGY